MKLCKPSHILNGTSENGGAESTMVQITLVRTNYLLTLKLSIRCDDAIVSATFHS